VTSADRILILLVVCALPFLYISLWNGSGDAGYLQIQAGTDEPLTEELSPDRILHIHGPLGDSVIEVSDGRARFLSSPCRGQVCVRSGWLQAAGEIAACLPNRISMSLIGQHQRYDSINF
jgi:hypothetical protein